MYSNLSESYQLSENSARSDIMAVSNASTVYSHSCDNSSLNATCPPCPIWLIPSIDYQIQTSVVTLVLSVFALLSNFSFLITVKKTNCLRKTVCIQLVALSIVDLSISICYITTAFRCLFYLAKEIITFTSNAAYMFRFPLQVLASILVVSVTADRYWAISSPIESAAVGISRRVRLMILVTITISVIIAVFAIVNSILLSDLESIGYCLKGTNIYENLIPSRIYMAYRNFYIAYILLIVDANAIVTSVCLLVLIKKELARTPDLGLPKRYQAEQRNLTRMILVNTGVFIVCILFQDMMWFTLHTGLFHTYYWNFHLMQSLSSLINCGVNPVIYNIFSSRYRHAFLNTFPCLKCVCWKRNKREI